MEVSHAACAARLSGPGHEDGPQLAHCPGEAGLDLEIQGQASTRVPHVPEKPHHTCEASACTGHPATPPRGPQAKGGSPCRITGAGNEGHAAPWSVQHMQATHERGSLGVTHLALGLFPPSSLMLCRPRSHADTSIGPKGLATVLCCRSQAASILPRTWRNSFGSEKACGKELGQFHTQQEPQLLKIGNIFQSRPPPIWGFAHMCHFYSTATLRTEVTA